MVHSLWMGAGSGREVDYTAESSRVTLSTLAGSSRALRELAAVPLCGLETLEVSPG